MFNDLVLLSIRSNFFDQKSTEITTQTIPMRRDNKNGTHTHTYIHEMNRKLMCVCCNEMPRYNHFQKHLTMISTDMNIDTLKAIGATTTDKVKRAGGKQSSDSQATIYRQVTSTIRPEI